MANRCYGISHSSSLSIGLVAAILFGPQQRRCVHVSRSICTKLISALATSTDPGLLKKGSRFEPFETVSGQFYPKIRVFYHEHPQAKKLPADLPLLVWTNPRHSRFQPSNKLQVFIHGLGGSAAQFGPLLTSLVNVAPCLAIDLPGCGRSEFKPSDDEAYTTLAFAELLFAAIDKYRDKALDQKIILFGHSMGCSIAALLTSSDSPLSHLCSQHVLGLVAICPRSTAPTDENLNSIHRLQWLWSPIFDIMRLVDRAGGVDSASVLRVVGRDADYETRKLQLRFNQQSSSAVFQKVLKGIYIQESSTREKGEESILGQRTWAAMKVPMFLVAAENDKLAPPKEVNQIEIWLCPTSPREEQDDICPENKSSLSLATQEPTIPNTAGDVHFAQERLSKYKTTQTTTHSNSSTIIEESHASTKHSLVLKTTVFPGPASHGLLYAQKDVRILSSLIEGFLAKYVDERLSPGWQLQHLTTSGKWDVKNLKKWQSILPCSDPIGGIFRAMKTMREIDNVHNPKTFVQKYSYKVIPDGVAMVVDISHDVPVYNKEGLEEGGVEYHKFPTVSKQPPTPDEVQQFIGLIDTLRQGSKISEAPAPRPTFGVHCHYGFNRTGFFLVSYLVEKEKWKVEDAIAEFAEKKAPGIKHEHFINELYARYTAKMERRNTVVD